MKTNKPEVVAWRWFKPTVNDQGETVGGIWKLGGAPSFQPWWTNEPLIRLSDYEALQAECEKLRKDAERYRWLRAAHTARPINLTICSVTDWNLEPWSGDDPDAAIDAATETQK